MEDPVKTDLRYEETPVIDPLTVETGSEGEKSAEVYEKNDVIPEAAQVFQPSTLPHEGSPPQDVSGGEKIRRKNHIGTIIVIVILFGLGIWLSTQLRSFFSPATTGEIAVPTASAFPFVTTAPTQATSSAVPDSSWVAYPVTNGVSYKLPPTVKFRPV